MKYTKAQIQEITLELIRRFTNGANTHSTEEFLKWLENHQAIHKKQAKKSAGAELVSNYGRWWESRYSGTYFVQAQDYVQAEKFAATGISPDELVRLCEAASHHHDKFINGSVSNFGLTVKNINTLRARLPAIRGANAKVW